jgi:MFS family permease
VTSAKSGWPTLLLVCVGQFMVILDVSIVNVALPSIRNDLHFSQVDLQWVVNAYTLTFAGFLMLGGRACDLLGRRRVFIGGLLLFALASLVGGLSQSQGMLIGARAAQGLGGAVVSPATLAILTTSFAEGPERNRALGVWGAMGGAGGATGALLGGVLTDLLSWQWILFVNVPIGTAVALAAPRFVAEGRNPERARSFDLAGAVTVTAGLVALVFGIVRTDAYGWTSVQTLGPMAAGLALIAVFLVIEGRLAESPLMPLRIFASRTLTGANRDRVLPRFGRFRHVVLRLAVPPAGTRLLAAARRARVRAHDAGHRRRLGAGVPRRHACRGQAAARHRNGLPGGGDCSSSRECRSTAPT